MLTLPEYPWESLAPYRRTAQAHPGGICDLSIATLRGAEGNGGNHGRYFLQPSPWDDQVSDSLGRFVDQVRYG